MIYAFDWNKSKTNSLISALVCLCFPLGLFCKHNVWRFKLKLGWHGKYKWSASANHGRTSYTTVWSRCSKQQTVATLHITNIISDVDNILLNIANVILHIGYWIFNRIVHVAFYVLPIMVRHPALQSKCLGQQIGAAATCAPSRDANSECFGQNERAALVDKYQPP